MDVVFKVVVDGCTALLLCEKGQLLLSSNSMEPISSVLDILDGVVDFCTVDIHAFEGLVVHLEVIYELDKLRVGSVEVYDAVLAHDVERHEFTWGHPDHEMIYV